MPTPEEWKAAFPVASSLSWRGVQMLYSKEGGAKQFLDELLDGKIPEPWAQEANYITDRQVLIAHRIERAVDKFDRTIAKLAEIVKSMEGRKK